MFNFSDEVSLILKVAETEMLELAHSFVGTEHLMLSILKSDNEISRYLNSKNINYNNFKKEVIKCVNKNENKVLFIFYTPNLKKVIDTSIDYVKENNLEEVDLKSLFLSMLEEKEALSVIILKKMKINIKLIYKDISKLHGGVNTTILYDIGVDLTEKAKNNEIDKVIGRDKEISRIIEILARKNKNNPVLIGEAGVGKTAIVEELARKIVKKEVPFFLKNHKIISLNISSLVAGTKYRGEFEEKLNNILKEVEVDDKVIVFIDELHTLVGAGGAEGAIDASNILKPALARKKIKLIGATTIKEYKKFIEDDKALERRFEKVLIEEPNEEKTYEILKGIKKDYEKYHNVRISESILKDIIYYSSKYIKNKYEPDKSIDVLDEVCAKTSILADTVDVTDLDKKLENVRKSKNRYIKTSDFEKAIKCKQEEEKLIKEYNRVYNSKVIVNKITLKSVIESKTNSIIYEMENPVIFKKIKKKLNDRIINQSNAIEEVFNSYIKSLTSKNVYTILLNGKEGCGKSYLIKNLSELTKTNLIILDMKEYKNEMSINRFIGSPSGYVGYKDNNLVFEKLKLYPNSIIHIKNLEKAYYQVVEIIKGIIENNFLEDSKGEKISFNNTLIVFESTLLNKRNIGFNNNFEKQANKFILGDQINKVINFNSLSKEDIVKIIDKYNIDEKTKKIILEESNYEVSGAKKIENLIKDKCTNIKELKYQ